MNFLYFFTTIERVTLNEIQEPGVRCTSDKLSAGRSTEIYSKVDLLGYTRIFYLEKIHPLFNYYFCTKIETRFQSQEVIKDKTQKYTCRVPCSCGKKLLRLGLLSTRN